MQAFIFAHFFSIRQERKWDIIQIKRGFYMYLNAWMEFFPMFLFNFSILACLI